MDHFCDGCWGQVFLVGNCRCSEEGLKVERKMAGLFFLVTGVLFLSSFFRLGGSSTEGMLCSRTVEWQRGQRRSY